MNVSVEAQRRHDRNNREQVLILARYILEDRNSSEAEREEAMKILKREDGRQ